MSAGDKKKIYVTKREKFKAAQSSTQSTPAATSTGAVNVVVEEDGAEKSADPTHAELREMCGFMSVNVESPPYKEELGSIDRVDRWGFVFA